MGAAQSDLLESTRRSLPARLLLVFAVFAVLGAAVWGGFAVLTRNLRSSTPWGDLATTSALVGLVGALAWGLVCGRTPHPTVGRAAVAGLVGGGLIHPVFAVLAFVVARQWPSPSQLLVGLAFTLFVGGLFSVPAGVAAGLISRSLERAIWGRGVPSAPEFVSRSAP